jgi:hypothetical protein
MVEIFRRFGRNCCLHPVCMRLSCVLKVRVTYRVENKGPSFVGDELTKRCRLTLLL